MKEKKRIDKQDGERERRKRDRKEEVKREPPSLYLLSVKVRLSVKGRSLHSAPHTLRRQVAAECKSRRTRTRPGAGWSQAGSSMTNTHHRCALQSQRAD